MKPARPVQLNSILLAGYSKWPKSTHLPPDIYMSYENNAPPLPHARTHIVNSSRGLQAISNLERRPGFTANPYLWGKIRRYEKAIIRASQTVILCVQVDAKLQEGGF